MGEFWEGLHGEELKKVFLNVNECPSNYKCFPSGHGYHQMLERSEMEGKMHFDAWKFQLYIVQFLNKLFTAARGCGYSFTKSTGLCKTCMRSSVSELINGVRRLKVLREKLEGAKITGESGD
jgi:hypothetical protein